MIRDLPAATKRTIQPSVDKMMQIYGAYRASAANAAQLPPPAPAAAEEECVPMDISTQSVMSIAPAAPLAAMPGPSAPPASVSAVLAASSSSR